MKSTTDAIALQFGLSVNKRRRVVPLYEYQSKPPITKVGYAPHLIQIIGGEEDNSAKFVVNEEAARIFELIDHYVAVIAITGADW